MACNRNCRQGRDCDCRPTAPAVDPVVMTVIDTTARAGAPFSLTENGQAWRRAWVAYAHARDSMLALVRIRRQRRAVA